MIFRCLFIRTNYSLGECLMAPKELSERYGTMVTTVLALVWTLICWMVYTLALSSEVMVTMKQQVR